MKERRLAWLVVGYDFIRAKMALPKDTKIVGVMGDAETAEKEVFGILVEHPGLKLLDDGEDIPTIMPEWITYSITESIFADWGQGIGDETVAAADRMTEADAQRSYTHARPEPDTLPPTERPKA